MENNRSRARVGDYVTLIRGTTYKGALVGKPGPALLGLGSIVPGGGFRTSDFQTYGGDCPSELMLVPGDIYASLKGATKDGKMIGSVARVPPSVPSGRLTQDTVKLVFEHPRPEDVSFVYWMLRTPQYRDYCAGHAMGSAVVALSRTDFLNYPLPPSTRERRLMVSLLDRIDERMELSRRMAEALESLAYTLFKGWFVDFDPVLARTEGRDTNLPPGVADLFSSRLGPDGLPEGWKYQSVLSMADWVNGAAYKDMHFSEAPDALPVVKIAELKNGLTSSTKRTNTDLGDRYRIQPGELLFSWSGSPETSIDAFIWVQGEAWLNQHVFAVRPNGKASRAYLFSMLKFLKRELVAIARDKQTTGLGHITRQDLDRLQVSEASPPITTEFEAVIQPLYERLQSTLTEIQTLSQLRDTLLAKLIAGDVRIADATAAISAA